MFQAEDLLRSLRTSAGIQKNTSIIFFLKSTYDLNKKFVKYKNKIVPAFVQKKEPLIV